MSLVERPLPVRDNAIIRVSALKGSGAELSRASITITMSTVDVQSLAALVEHGMVGMADLKHMHKRREIDIHTFIKLSGLIDHKYNTIVKAIKPLAQRLKDGKDTFSLLDFWRANEGEVPAFAYVLRAVLSNAPNSIPPERVFSILNQRHL